MSHYSGGVYKAKIGIVGGEEYYVQINPNKLEITDGVSYKDKEKSDDFPGFINVPGRRMLLGQYTAHTVKELKVSLLFDTYTSEESDILKKDVKKEYIDKFLKLITNKDGKPPMVFFSWGSIQLMGVVTNMNYTYTLFAYQGKPVRAEMNLTIKEYWLVD